MASLEGAPVSMAQSDLVFLASVLLSQEEVEAVLESSQESTDNSLTVVPESPTSSPCSSNMDSSQGADVSVVPETPPSSQTSLDDTVSESRGSLFLGTMEDEQKENALPVVDREGMMRCHICYKWLKNSSIKMHLRRHKKDFHIACCECKETFISTDMLKEHVARQHKSGQLCECIVCGKKLSTYRGMREHVKSHSGDVHECDVCHWKTPSKAQLARHKKSHNKCEECTVCKKVFASKTQLKQHTITHTESPQLYGCPTCTYTSKWQTSVKRHVETKHSDARDHVCDTCGKSFKDASNLARHIKNVKCDRVRVDNLWKDLF